MKVLSAWDFNGWALARGVACALWMGSLIRPSFLGAMEPSSKTQTKKKTSIQFKGGSSSNHFKLESTVNTGDGRFTSNLLGFGQDFEGTLQKDERDFPWKISYRLWLDREKLEPPYNPSYQLIERILAQMTTSVGNMRVTAGWQEMTWGENLIMPILDVVNPRDMTHPYGYYDSQAKIPQPLIVFDKPFDSHKIEFIINPAPTPMKYPEEAVGFKVKGEDRKPPDPRFWEFGTRITLVREALETKLYYYRHGTRIPTFVFLPYASGDSEQAEIQAQSIMSDTFGTSISLASFQWLLRGDLAVHTHHPATNINSKVEKTTTTQGILGLSTITMTQQSFGAELHVERWEREPVAFKQEAFVRKNIGPGHFSWLGLLANFNFLREQLNPSFIYFHGLNSDDSLFRIGSKYNLNTQSTLSLEWQSTFSKTSSPKLLLSDRDTISSRFSYIF